jgi:aminoacyl-tRNA hydrolase
MGDRQRLTAAIRWRVARIHTHVMWPAYIGAVQGAAYCYRRLLRRTQFVGITGSAGKTTTKDLLASILESHFRKGQKGHGTDNGPFYVAKVVLRTRPSDAYCVNEIAICNEAGVGEQVSLFQPTVGVVTNIGTDHLSAYGTSEGIAEEKSKLIRALPANGIAVLNADDPRVLDMRNGFGGRIVTYGTSEEAMLRGVDIKAAWPDRLSLTVEWQGTSVRVQTQLSGDHWVNVVLAALATGVAMGVPPDVAARAIAGVEPFEGRMSPVNLPDGVTFIRDDWKAPLWTLSSTLDFLRNARARRKVIVVGTLSDYPGDSARRYVQVARQALDAADCAVFVGPWASSSLRAKRAPGDNLYAFGTVREASAFLSRYLASGDLVLLKGSTRADHLERLIMARTEKIHCWRSACGRMYFCPECYMHRTGAAVLPEGAGVLLPPLPIACSDTDARELPITSDAPVEREASEALVIVGLGNPGPRYDDTPHNVGVDVVEIVGKRLGGDWSPYAELGQVLRSEYEGNPVWLVRLACMMNDAGSALLPLSSQLGFGLQQCVLVHDDLDLPFGAVRTRMRGGAGGHRGVLSILEAFQNDQVRRIKIGIGRPPSEKVSPLAYVLTPLIGDQLAMIRLAENEAADRAIELARAMQPSLAGSTARGRATA